MASQAIKEYGDFAGQDGYVIVDGLDAQTPGGKKLLSEIGGISESDLIDALEEISPRFDEHNTVLQGGESAGIRSSISLRFDNTLTALDDTRNPQSTSKILSVTNPVPPTTNANVGDVLTYSDTDGIVWAAPQGGGSNLPEYTTDDENKVLGVFVDREWDRQSSKYVITGSHLGWKEGIPEFPNLGSGGEWGLEPVVKLSYKYNGETEEYETSTEAGAAGCPYNTFGENGDAQYGTWRFKEWEDYGDNPYSVVNNTYVAEIDNNWFINFGYLKDGYDPDPEYSEPEHPDANSILFKVKHHGAIIPFVGIEFINETGKTLTVSVESEETGGGFGETMVPISDNGTTVNNTIPNNTYVQITVLGHGYTIKTQSTDLPVH